MSILLQLFLVFLKVGAFSFGGGYASLPLIQSEVVDVYGWLTINEFNNLVTISQMTPGPISINSATFVGNRVYGVVGSIVSTLGNVTPSIIIVTLLAIVYNKYKNLKLIKGILYSLRPAVVSLIATAGMYIFIPSIFKSGTVEFSNGNLMIRPIVYFICAMYLLRKKRLDPIVVMLIFGFIELVFTFMGTVVI